MSREFDTDTVIVQLGYALPRPRVSAYIDLKRAPDASSSFNVNTVKRSSERCVVGPTICLESKAMEYDSWNWQHVKRGGAGSTAV
ncbi:hypothetical protein EAG_05752 [Camponotus floridanus]|uniref:Uncharacterized protein n=1 Tax=Camponotus floridanus TaxID=104421 RepID=E2ABU9_CAMFO|nr:hypothetical protein EAG_05752 [Camponotus floridanus]